MMTCLACGSNGGRTTVPKWREGSGSCYGPNGGPYHRADFPAQLPSRARTSVFVARAPSCRIQVDVMGGEVGPAAMGQILLRFCNEQKKVITANLNI
jgi:hypothetical protein